MRLLIIAKDIQDGLYEYNKTYPIGNRDKDLDVYIAYCDNTLSDFDHTIADEVIGTRLCDSRLLEKAKMLHQSSKHANRNEAAIDIESLKRHLASTLAVKFSTSNSIDSMFDKKVNNPALPVYSESELVPNPGEYQPIHPLKRLITNWI